MRTQALVPKTPLYDTDDYNESKYLTVPILRSSNRNHALDMEELHL